MFASKKKKIQKYLNQKAECDRNAFDLDEPDDDITYALESKEQLYRVISETIATLK